MPIHEMPDAWTPLHAFTLLLLAVAAADGEIQGSEVTVITSRLAEHLEGDTEKAVAMAEESYAYLRNVWQQGGANAADATVLEQARIVYEEHGEGSDKLRAYVVLLVEVAKAHPDIHDTESSIIHTIVEAWGLQNE